jgi:hypothetical protein
MPLEWKAPSGLFSNRQNVQRVFETIYSKAVWGGGSGCGSSPQFAAPYMNVLQAFLRNTPGPLGGRHWLQRLAVFAIH